jgi:SAM-dependent methyltransferase
MSSPKLSRRLKDILICPLCHGSLGERDDALNCQNCSGSFPLNDSVPVFLSEPLQLVAADHASNAIGSEYEEILRQGNDFTLHIGAGATGQRYPNCVEFEHKIFRHTDVVGDAHHLPFRDATFDRVFAFNVFEHLRAPKNSAAEIFRVLKPGGWVAIHTAFLQPLHEEPHHFFNATEFGVREWFSDFEIERCDVSKNFSPGAMLGYIAANLLYFAGQSGAPVEEQNSIADSTLRQWADFWARKTGPPKGFPTLENLPQHLQKRLAAGFELIAKKPDGIGR